jgi:glycosyltransferase involved in cell wall biosynthesis/SAM-dependent methyltransferase
MSNPASLEGGRLLILIVAYNAEKTIRQVLTRIPAAALPPGTEVLIIDDSSGDRTFEVARASREALRGLTLTILRNPENQGYGGNQKIGYQYAIDRGFAVVALLHGDGQYAPEMLPALVAPVRAGEADACFGSRMMARGQALRQGMPLYKYVGNRLLTGFQNRVLGMKLSEFHSGYRVYSVAALRALPFRLNTNDFHFDTEIIIQFRRKGLRLHEIPIPTYYGDEICYVNGCAYAWHVIRATLASRLHAAGVFYARQYDVAGSAPAYEAKLDYPSSHTLAAAAVPPHSQVLDLACGPGHVARVLTAKGCRVTGVDCNPVTDGPFAEFRRHDLNAGTLPPDLGACDVVLLLDCLEHLDAPEALLDRVREQLYTPRIVVVATAPNVGFFVTRLALLLGQFNYGKQGILDLTHKRLFTFGSFRRMFEQAGYRVTRVQGIPAPFPKALHGRLGYALLAVNRWLIAVWRGFFAYQIYLEARPLPPLRALLARTLEASGEAVLSNVTLRS